MTAQFRSRDRLALGPRGTATRAAILAAVDAHLRATPWHRASVPALARAAGRSPGSFYEFFEDLPHAVRTLAAGSDGEVPEHLRLIVELLDFEDGHLGQAPDA